jgi:DEAD/DEAH box helicase domain-containing protein
MSKDTNINSIIDYWINTPDNYENITHIQNKKEFSGNFYEIPDFLNPELILSLKNNGISKLFSHQAAALNSVFAGKNVVVTTGPSSGKSLIYLLPVFFKDKISSGFKKSGIS